MVDLKFKTFQIFSHSHCTLSNNLANDSSLTSSTTHSFTNLWVMFFLFKANQKIHTDLTLTCC